MEILVRRGNSDAPKPQIIFCDVQFIGGRRLGWIDAGKSNQLLGKAVDIFRDVTVGNFRPQVSALESQNEGFINRGALCPVMIRIGGGYATATLPWRRETSRRLAGRASESPRST